MAEILSKKHYVENWRSELNQEFCFWSFTQWKQVRDQLGYEAQGCPIETGP